MVVVVENGTEFKSNTRTDWALNGFGRATRLGEGITLNSNQAYSP